MSVGAFIDRRGLETGLDLEGLTYGLLGKRIIAVVGEMSVAALADCVRENHLVGLVVATGDEERGGEIAREALRGAGKDPFALKVLNLADLCARVHRREQATAKAVLLVAAAAAMVRHYPWLRPENLRLRIGGLAGRLSRRALLTLPRPRYEVIPAVNGNHCAASRGCNLCLKSCPIGAINVVDGVACVDKDRCRDCSVCVSACPTGAIDHPYYRRPVIDTGLAALLGDVPLGRGEEIIAFACRGAMEMLREAGRRRIDYRAEILPLEAPSLGFVDLYLVLRAFDLGAAGVLILGCDGACPCGCRPEPSSSNFRAIGRVLGMLGVGSERFAPVNATSAQRLATCLNAFADYVLGLPPQPLRQESPAPGEAHRYQAAGLLAGICLRASIGDALSLEDDELPLGKPVLRADACSLCGLCADTCPTGALKYSEDSAYARLEFTARDCTGCRLCSAACPEDALRIARRLEPSSLAEEAVILKTAGLVRCRQCGQAYAPEALLERVRAQLGDSAPPSMDSYCPDCRLTATMGRRGAGAA